jgi:hypothetical protein
VVVVVVVVVVVLGSIFDPMLGQERANSLLCLL